ncbi:FG-GAP repeat [Luteitalea pratensis]|uniref:FG-GAP repeat n=1 Tax=Luteitalea pratensis TaxID=1855912 RepID=A0A143PXT0_LUTPR|nr:CRTAC1 family protein [Luteitalea pratensis]AMY12644.1 FG-GAP repeat [Luteitalea pratensis]
MSAPLRVSTLTALLLVVVAGVAPDGSAWLSQPGVATVPRFDNVQPQSGITFVLAHAPTAAKRLIETMPGGLAAFDYDGDGRVDLFFANGNAAPTGAKSDASFHNRLYRNLGGFRFEDTTAAAGLQGRGYAMGAAVADYDNDGDPDVFVPGVGQPTLYRNLGNGRFEDVTATAGITPSAWSVAAAWTDVDKDGRLDLFVVNYLDWNEKADRFCGDRMRDLRVYCHPKFYPGLPNQLYRNRGDGTFEDISRSSGIAAHIGKGMSVGVGDFDADGRDDLFVTNDGVPNFLFRNVDGKRFEETALLAGVALPGFGRPVSSMGVAVKDVTGDGRPDLLVTALKGETFPLFVNDGGMTFHDGTHQARLAGPSSQRSGWGVSLVDLDNDGRPDIVTANSHVNDLIDQFEASSYKEPNTILLNRGNGFEDATAQAGDAFGRTAAAHRGLVAADLDDDGRQDVVTTSLGAPVEVWRNGGPAGHWLRIVLRGRASNRDGIGATITVGDRRFSMTSASGYASSVLQGVHVGLGSATSVPRIEVHWPSGRRQVVDVTGVDRIVEVTEPEA